MVVMDVFTRRIIGFGVEPAHIDGISVCRMFNQARYAQPLPKRLSTDHDPLFRFHRWRANLRVLDIEELKSVPFAPRSHPFIERLIGTLRREYLDYTISDGLYHRRRSTLPTITSGAFTPVSVVGRPSSDAGKLRANRRIFITSPGDPTVLDCSTRRFPRNQEFAMDRLRERHRSSFWTLPGCHR
jgi:transposase InsO family protein